jgi:serine/threonine-protein kinase
VIGTTLDGKYKIQKLLGAGAMGQVFQAEHAATGRRVAVKVISSPDFVRDQTVVTRFQREARAAGAIDTQHITQVLDAGVDHESGLPFLVMEFMTGEDLQQLIKRIGPLAPDLALRVVAQGCLGLAKAHDAGVVHRDMKPANLFLAKRDAGEIIIKVLDFGIAKVKMDQAHETESAGLTKTGSMLGSPLYMSPEQARGDVKHIDHRTDIWSMGVVLYQALSGRTPYQHVTALGQLIIAICSEWPKHIQEVAPWVPAEVAAIVHRCLRHNPDERYQSATEMFQAIRALLPNGWTINEEMMVPLHDTQRAQVANKLALTAQLASAQTVANAPGGGAASTDATTQTAPAAAPSSGSKVGLGVAAVALVGAAAAAAFVFTRGPAATPAVPVASAAVSAVASTVPAALTASAAVEAPAPADTSRRRVKVVVLPIDAQVEIEEEPAKLSKDGLLEITGSLGSVHRVHVHKGKLETTVDVSVTETGALPPKIELTATPPKATTSAAAPGVPPPKKGIDTKFE